MTFRQFAAAGFRGRGPRAMRGAIAASRLIALAVIVVVLALGGLVVLRPKARRADHSRSTAPAPTAPTAATPAAPNATVSDELTVDQLYREARKAMNENRMAAPAGNNALEFYLKILAKQPDDSGAKDALRELFPFATGAAEDQINQGNFDEANRVIALLAQADPSNYSLTILRSKLDAKKKLAEREQAAAAAAAAAKPQAPGVPRHRRMPRATAGRRRQRPKRRCRRNDAGSPRRPPPPCRADATASTTTPPPAAAPTPRPTARRRHRPAARRAKSRSRARRCRSIRSPLRATVRKAGWKSSSRSAPTARSRTRT